MTDEMHSSAALAARYMARAEVEAGLVPSAAHVAAQRTHIAAATMWASMSAAHSMLDVRELGIVAHRDLSRDQMAADAGVTTHNQVSDRGAAWYRRELASLVDELNDRAARFPSRPQATVYRATAVLVDRVLRGESWR